MRKYLELFKDAFDDSIGTKTKPENKPYIGYSLTEGKLVYTVVPKPAVGPADNEIWYTSSDGNVVNPSNTDAFGVNIVSNTYENGKGVISFSSPVTKLGEGVFSWVTKLESLYLPSGVVRIEMEAFNYCQNLTDIYFNGVIEKWNSIEFGKDINSGCPTITVHCTDGDITFPANN